VNAAVALVRDAYWNEGVSDAILAASHRASVAWVGLEHEGRLVATARAISDRVKRSWIYDVAVDHAYQRQGVGTALMELMLDHPMVRETNLFLTTRDAMPFYAGLRFVEVWTEPPTDGRWARTHMMRQRRETVTTQSQPMPFHAQAPGGGTGVEHPMSQVESGMVDSSTQSGSHGSTQPLYQTSQTAGSQTVSASICPRDASSPASHKA
jgi:GNAT superfamily N-acetyltransferase